MSWDTAIYRNSQEKPIGTLGEILTWLAAYWNFPDWTPSTQRALYLYAPDYRLEASFTTVPELEFLMKHIRRTPGRANLKDIMENAPTLQGPGDEIARIVIRARSGGNPIHDLVRFCKQHDLVLMDQGAGRPIDLNNPSSESFEAWRNFRKDIAGDL